MAKRHQAAGDLSEAAACFEQAIKRAARPAALWVDLGNLRQDQGDQDEALRCYEKAVQLESDCIAARQNLGYLLFNRGETERALAQYEVLLQLEPSPINRLLAAGVVPIIYDSQQDVEDTRKRLESDFAELVADEVVVDATEQLVPTAFFIAYQGQNDREIMEARGRIITGTNRLQAPRVHLAGGRRKVGLMSAYFRDHTIGRLKYWTCGATEPCSI